MYKPKVKVALMNREDKENFWWHLGDEFKGIFDLTKNIFSVVV